MDVRIAYAILSFGKIDGGNIHEMKNLGYQSHRTIVKQKTFGFLCCICKPLRKEHLFFAKKRPREVFVLVRVELVGALLLYCSLMRMSRRGRLRRTGGREGVRYKRHRGCFCCRLLQLMRPVRLASLVLSYLEVKEVQNVKGCTTFNSWGGISLARAMG